MLKYSHYLLTLVLLMTACTSIHAQRKHKDFLIRYCDQHDACGYKDTSAVISIPAGKYSYLFTDTFYNTAIVQDRKEGIVAIDRKGNILYHIFVFDNGPDYTEEGLYRIYEKGKYGFASMDRVVIPPTFDFVYPFSDGRAVYVSGCTFQPDSAGEHSVISGGTYGYIDSRGRVLRSAVYSYASSFENGVATVSYQGEIIRVDRNFKRVER